MRGRPRWVDVLGSNVQFGKHVVTDADAAFGHCYGPNSNIAGNKLNLFPAVFGPCIFRISYSYHVGCGTVSVSRRYLYLEDPRVEQEFCFEQKFRKSRKFFVFCVRRLVSESESDENAESDVEVSRVFFD